MDKDKRYSLFLISPAQKYVNYPAHTELSRIFGKKRFMIPLALPVIAALTPDNYDIKIIDEEIEPIPENATPDIVGITTLASTSTRAFQIADNYRKKGIPVVMGGAYASYRVEEALKHADSIVVGEAENNWKQCLADFEKGELKPVYTCDTFCDYSEAPLPRWDLVPMNKIFQAAVQVSRGCPFNCDFCIVSQTFGRKMRYRNIDNVVDEISRLPSKYVFFVDDNLTMNHKYVRELMQRIQPLHISWGCMASIDIANDDTLLTEMADAGCFNILVGFESLNPQSLDETHKKHNKGASIYEEAIRKIHSHGIHINASFIVGFDNDTAEEFDRIFDFTLKNSLPNINLHILSATPGTRLYDKMQAEGRMYPHDFAMNAGHFPVLHYMKMSQSEIFEKYMQTIARLYSFDTILRKAKQLFGNGNFAKPGADISTGLKFRLMAIIIGNFVFTTDKNRRKLLFFMLRNIREGKIAKDRAFAFMLSMLGYHRHVQKHLRRMDEYRNLIKPYDKGAFESFRLQHSGLEF
ncbi:MAG: B12-binding domain-containing radical SAM protein [Lentimicrobiaceae bacterium]|nr:B12-binding domain-containing radical SAM protein [Lentimicrobiaceae bacterium]